MLELIGALLAVTGLSWAIRRGHRVNPFLTAAVAGAISAFVAFLFASRLRPAYAGAAAICAIWMYVTDERRKRHIRRRRGFIPDEPLPRRPAQPARVAQPTAPSWLAVLELSPGASWTDVRAAYKRLAREYHPDRVASMPKGFREFASERMIAINGAFASARANHADADVHEEPLGGNAPVAAD